MKPTPVKTKTTSKSTPAIGAANGPQAAAPDLLPLEALEKAADCLKVMAHPVRLRMVDLLMQGEYRVQDLSELCAVQPNQACEHLRLMKSCGLLGAERRGREVYYTIQSPQLPALLQCIRAHCGAK
jgi:DNA-binding transcriptional ArsR family regulator